MNKEQIKEYTTKLQATQCECLSIRSKLETAQFEFTQLDPNEQQKQFVNIIMIDNALQETNETIYRLESLQRALNKIK